MLIPPLLMAAVSVLKAIYGTDKVQETTIEHAKPHIALRGKSDKERLADLGLV